MIGGLFFYLFATVLLGAATATICARQPVHAVLFLILAFFNAAGLLLTLGAEFLAFILLIVYVGAVAVLFLFVVMMLDVRVGTAVSALARFGKVGLGVAGILGGQLVTLAVLWPQAAEQAVLAAAPLVKTTNTQDLGRVLYTDAMLPFQLSGAVLLVAIIGAIVLTYAPRRKGKRQDVREQLAARPEEVVRLHDVKIGQGAE